MIVSDKVRIKIIIINIIILIFVYFFSFHLSERLFFYNKFDYKEINTNAKSTIVYMKYDFQAPSAVINKKNLQHETDIFLDLYFNYLKKNPHIISEAPCPSELMINNLRNIQIYKSNKNDDFLENPYKFNVRFNFYKFSESTGKLNMNKCFDYIFKENLNKYYLLYRDKIIENINDEIIILEKIYNIDDLQILDLKSSTFPLNNENDKTPIKKKIKDYKNLIKIIKMNNFFIDPDASYTVVKQNPVSSTKIVIFVTCLLIVVSINILINKLNRKQVAKFINKLMNAT